MQSRGIYRKRSLPRFGNRRIRRYFTRLGDTTAPSSPSPTGQIAYNVVVSWPAIAPVGAETITYRVYKNGVELTTIPGQSETVYLAIGVIDGDSFGVVARDNSGNESAAGTFVFTPPSGSGTMTPNIRKIVRAADRLSVDVHFSSPVEIITFAQGFADQNFQVGMQAPDNATAVTSSVITLFYPDGVGDDAPWELDAQPNWLVTAVQFPDSGIVQAATGGSGDASEASVQKILRVVQAMGDS